MPKNKFQASQNNLFDMELIEHQQVADNAYLSESTQKMLLEMLHMGCNKFVISSMLQMANVPARFVQYMEGPVITHRCGWMDSIPNWVFNAVYVERLEKIFEELKQGKPGELATPAEVLACIYPASMEAPMMSHWADTYFWCGATVIPRHRPDYCASPEKFWEHIGSSPISYERVRHDFEYIGRDIRAKVIKHAPRTLAKGFAKTASKQAEKVQDKKEPETVQINLLDFM